MSKRLEDWLKGASEREIQIRYDKDTDEFEARLFQCDRPFGSAKAFTIDGAMRLVRDEDEKEEPMADGKELTPQERIDQAAIQINAIMNPIAENPLGHIKGGELMNSLAEVLQTLGKL